MGERALLGGRYELGPAIGSGGFATVFRARDRQANTDVAVKLVPPGFDAGQLSARLRSEATVLERLKKLSSRHLARVFELGSDEQGVWLVTELIDGVPLSVEALGRALLPHEVLRVARGLLEGLSVAHGAGVVHADVKPSNILVPRTEKALDGPKLIDFGLARITSRADLARELGDSAPHSGVVVGSARWMAPEVLSGHTADMRSDVYAAGLVLFELLGEGDLFPSEDRREQLRARVVSDPVLEPRVPPPLSVVLARMLARDPGKRYRDATEALGAVIDLDTAPVSTVSEDAPPASMRASRPSFGVGAGTSTAPPLASRALGTAAPPSMRAPRVASIPSGSIPSAPPLAPLSHSRPYVGHGPPSSVPVAPRGSTTRPPPPASRLRSLPENGADGLRDTLRHLDLPMLDALARRERGNATGRVARGVALALRLELDAAALILEPLAMSSDIARAVGATVLAPRARRVTRARVDSDRDDKWIDTVPAELGALLACFAAALSSRDDAQRDASRCTRCLERLDREVEGADVETRGRIESARVTLRIAVAAARVRSGELTSGAALDLVAPLETGDGRTRSALDRVVRPLLAAAIGVRVDEGRARDDLERAVRASNESGATLLEACASAAWGRLLVDAPLRVEQGLAVLERATTLLAHGDAPSLEHEAEHHRAAALIVQGRWKEAVPRLRAAREAAHAERAIEAEVLSASLEVVAHLALGDHDPAREAADALGAARIGTARGRAAALAWIAKCLEALASGEREAAEDALAEASARSREAGADSADAYVLVEVLNMLFDAAKGALPDVVSPAAELERFAAERGFTSFYWFDVLRSVLDRIDDAGVRASMQDVLARIAVLLGPASRIARERRTSAPPGFGP
ncbi:MAG: Serine/threonine protein kinase PrkC, regulator of stationary phase [Labilithrix sp.]|nr:Serine/threonine protein kinase PrkC, regulator of stationary phase [Labilithrix sp.]